MNPSALPQGLKTAAVALLFAALATGCGNLNARSRARAPGAPEGGIFSSTADLSGGTSSSCAARTPNIYPNWSGSGAGTFTACTGTNYYTVEIHGTIPGDPLDVYGGSGSELNETICVFPGQYYAADPEGNLPARVVWKPDAQGFPMVSCIPITDQGVFATFNGTTFDVLFIVTQGYRNQMRSCLVSGVEGNCPPFARGRFR
jgi:hypothetical protein